MVASEVKYKNQKALSYEPCHNMLIQQLSDEDGGGYACEPMTWRDIVLLNVQESARGKLVHQSTC